ncbi:hypothetical protein DFH28DRAFT_902954 [Melampsora americana]|nr:hypothetical protein DFH28DRAFT_902954 [Melampsora americana]
MFQNHQSIHSKLSQDTYTPTLNRLPSDASSANLSDPSYAGPSLKVFSPRSNTTTEHTSLPQDTCSAISHLLSPAPITPLLKNMSQSSHQSDPFGIDRPSTSSGLHHHPSQTTSVERRPYSSLQATDHLNPNQTSSELPSFSYCTGDKGIEDLLETLGYSSGLTKSKSSSTMRSSHDPTSKDQTHGRDPVVMLDIEGDEFTIHEHSLSPVTERTELSTISSKQSSNRQRPFANPQAILAQRLMPQNRFRPTAPLSLSPKPKHLSPLSTSSVSSSTNRHSHLDRPHSSQGVSTSQDPIPSGSNLSDRAKIFGTSKTLRPRDTLTKSASSHDLFSPPLQSSSLFPDDTHLTGAATSRPSLQRIPKKATALIQMFEGGSSSAPGSQSNIPIGFPPHKPRPLSLSPTKPNSSSAQAASSNRSQHSIPEPSGSTPSRLSAFEALEASRKARTARQQRQYVSESALNQFASTSTIPALDHDALTTSSSVPFEETAEEQQRIQSRNERRERVAQAERGQVVVPRSSPTKIPRQQRYQDSLKSPMSERLIQHRKSIASSITSNLTSPNQSIELNLRNCTAVESVRSKRSYGPDFSDPHLHMLRIAWTEFDSSTNSRVEHEEYLGCTRATQRADWVGAIWQAAHDLGGFVEQPDIPLAGKSSPAAPTSPRPDPSNTTSQAPLEPESSPKPTQSSRLNAVTLVDRAMSVDESYLRPRGSCLVPSTPINQDISSAISTSAASVSSGNTTTLQSELDREYDRSLMGSTTLDLQRQPSVNHLYREEATQDLRQTLEEMMEQERGVVTGVRGRVEYLIDPNLERQLTRKSSRAKSPELDLFAMLDRMSVKGSIHNRTSQFYDHPPPSTPPPPPASAPMSMLQRQRSRDMHNPQPISPAEQANISALEQDADKNRRDSSHHSFHTIRPTSAAGIHERFLDSPRSSITSGSKAKSEHLRSSSAHSTPRNQRHILQDPGTTPRAEQLDSHNEHEPNTPIRRGAWSDVERRSAQTDLEGVLPKRAVQRDLQRILKTIERNDSKLIVQSNSLGDHLDNIQTQLQNVAAKLKGHELEREENFGGGEVEEPTIADKVDYMLSLCNILLESQHKVSTAVEKNLKAHGLNLDNKSVHTRSMRSATNYTDRNSSMTIEPKPISPVPVASLDEDQRSSFSRMPSPPLPPLPNEAVEAEAEAADEEVVKGAEEVLVPVEVQEAGLGRIENLLVALLSRMDEAAAAGKPTTVPEEPEMSPPPLPEKDESTEESDMRSTLNLDADVALWKSKGKGSISRSITDRSTLRRNNSNFTPTETDNSEQIDSQPIPDYNLAYEAEDAVARKIADERARAARRLEGISTPYGNQHLDLGRRSLYGISSESTRHPSNPEDGMMMQDGGVRHEKSHWSITASAPPPPPPPKDESDLPRLPSLRLSERVQSLRSSRSSATRPVSVISSATHYSQRQQPLPPVPMVLPTDEIKNVLKETLDDHSNQQAPMFDEMVTLLRTQDQVSQATVLNQAEVSRYLTQLNEHLEGVLVKKNEDVELITESVRKLQDQLAVLIEQSQRLGPTIERPEPDIDHGLTSGEEEADRGEETDQVKPEEMEGIHFEVEEGAGEVDVTVDVPPQEGADEAAHTRQFSTMTKRPSASHRIGGPRARKISLGKSLKGPRMPTTLANVGKLWGGPTPAADRAARWGNGGGGTLKRAPTNKTLMSTTGGAPVNVEGALGGLTPDEGGENVAADPDERTGTIALGVSHILKLLRENQTKEEERRRNKAIEKASEPKPVISNEMEERRAKIEELQLRREAALAEDKVTHMESLVNAMKQQAAEHERLLRQIVEQLDKKEAYEEGEEERNRRHEEAMEGVNQVLTTVESGVMTHLEEFKAQMFTEMKQTFEKVGELRDQKQQIQSDIADMLMFMSKVRGGGPDPRWQYPTSMTAPASISGGGSVNGVGENHVGYTPIPNLYPIPQMDSFHPTEPDRGLENVDQKSNSGFGPRPPGRR